MKKKIEKIVDEAKQLYCLQTQRLYLEDKKKENVLVKQYKGREIYELLQNIDDAAEDGKDCIASIKLDKNYLIISNKGKPFTISTLQRLCQGGVSEKDDKYIGCKGIGFRSVLNWADEISIYSGNDISVKFSREYAQNIYNELITGDAKEHINNQSLELDRRGYDSSYPIFRAPLYIEPIIDREFNTVIKLKIKEDARENIKESLKNIDENILLFLPHLKEIEIQFEEKKELNKTYSKIYEPGNIISIKINENNSEKSTQYRLYTREEKLAEKFLGSDKVGLGIAIPLEENYFCSEMPNIYTFFPVLGLKSPFPAFLHATLLLTDNRNDLDLSSEGSKKNNKEIFKKLLDFYIATIIENYDKENRLKLLMPFSIPANHNDKFTFNESIGKLGIEDYFINECKNREILYTVNENYIRGIDSPIILDSFPSLDNFKGENFNKLIKFIGDEKLRGFAKRIAKMDNNIEKYLYEAINKSSDNWNVEVRIKTFKWWNNENYTLLPKLLKKIDKSFHEDKNEPCFLSEDSIPDWVREIPEWAKISILDSEDQVLLIKVYEEEINKIKNSRESNKRVLPRIIRKTLVDIQEQSSRQVVISPINASITNYKQAREFILWLWKVWKETSFDDTIKNTINFKVPTSDKGVDEANNVYLGTEYGNSLGEKIFTTVGGYNKIGIELEGDINSAKAFFYEIGVSTYPRIQEISRKIETNNQSKLEKAFVEYVLSMHPLPEDNQDSVAAYNTKLYSIENIELILENLDTSLIIKWIFADYELKNAIENEFQPRNYSIGYRLRGQWSSSSQRHNNGWSLPSYLRYVFSNTKWIKINNQKYSPNELIITRYDLTDYGLINLLESDLESLSKDVCSVDELRNLLLILGVKTSYLELDASKFYNILLELPNKEESKAIRISRDIYRTIIDTSANIHKYKSLFESISQKRKDFLETGKVLVRKSNKSEFICKKEAFFSSSAVISTEGKFPIDIPARRGKKEDFEKILGIEPYEIKYEVKEVKESRCNNQFQNDLASFIPCIMCYRSGKKDEVVNLSVELVESVNITYENKTETINSRYTLLKKSNKHWFICVGNETEYHNIAKEQIAESLVQIFNVLFNFPSKDFLNKVEQLFIYNQRQREYLIESEFGGKDEIENTRHEIEETNNFYKEIGDFLCTDISIIKTINWRNPTIEDLEQIIKVLKESKKGIKELNEKLEREISIDSYNKHHFIREYERDRNQVYADIYGSFKDSDSEREGLKGKWNAFDEYIKAFNDNFHLLDFDHKNAYDEQKEKFYTENNITSAGRTQYSTIQDIYNKNIKILKEYTGEKDFNLNDFTNDMEKESLLFFEIDASELKKLVDNFIKDVNDTSEKEFNNLNKQDFIKNIIDNSQINNEPLPSGEEKKNNTTTHTGGAVSIKRKEYIGRKNKHQGNIAELIVINFIESNKIKEITEYFQNKEFQINWKSGAAKEIMDDKNHNYDCSQTDDSVGYDIELVSESKKMYIEVKSSSQSDCSFYMSANELDKAKSLSNLNERHRVIFVSNLNINDPTSSPKVTFIDAPITDAFDAIPIQYNIIYKDKKNS